MSDSWIEKRKIISMPGIPSSPMMVLARTLDKTEQKHVKSVYVAIEFTDGTFSADWSQMDVGVMAHHVAVAQMHLQNNARVASLTSQNEQDVD